MIILGWMILLSVGATVMWLLLRFATYTTPLAGLVGLALGGIGLLVQSHRLMAFGFGLLLFALVARAIGGGMNDEF